VAIKTVTKKKSRQHKASVETNNMISKTELLAFLASLEVHKKVRNQVDVQLEVEEVIREEDGI